MTSISPFMAYGEAQKIYAQLEHSQPETRWCLRHDDGMWRVLDYDSEEAQNLLDNHDKRIAQLSTQIWHERRSA